MVKVVYICDHSREVVRKDGQQKIIVHKTPVACVAIDGDAWGASFCRPNETFNRENGRSLAIGRLGKSEETPNRRIYDNNFNKTYVDVVINQLLAQAHQRVAQAQKAQSEKKKTKVKRKKKSKR